jgi:hypothetical protein
MALHKDLAAGRWFELSLMEQLANVGADVERTIRWKQRGAMEDSKMAFARALDLLDLTIADPKNEKRLKEILLAREALIDHFIHNNKEYNTTDEQWQNYFFDFNYAVAIQRGK